MMGLTSYSSPHTTTLQAKRSRVGVGIHLPRKARAMWLVEDPWRQSTVPSGPHLTHVPVPAAAALHRAMHAAYVVASRILGTNTSVLALLTDSVRCLHGTEAQLVKYGLSWDGNADGPISLSRPLPQVDLLGYHPVNVLVCGTGPAAAQQCDSLYQLYGLFICSMLYYHKLSETPSAQPDTAIMGSVLRNLITPPYRSSRELQRHVQSGGARQGLQECMSQGYKSRQVDCFADHGLPGE